jgi:hypothetical protein
MNIDEKTSAAPAPDLASRWKRRRIGRLGWHLVGQVMDEIDHARAGTGNRPTLVK